jgi:Rsm1-like
MHNIHSHPEFNLQVVLSYLPKNFFLAQALGSEESSVTAKPEINSVAFVMALFGWTGRPGNNVRDGAAICNSCFRTLGLWLFKSKEVNEAGEAVREATITYLDLIKEHREYCPWRNAKSQSGGTGMKKSAQGPELAAWEVIFRVLKNDYLLRTGGEDKTDKAKYMLGTEISIQADLNDTDAQSIRDEKDKERWARLRRVKSLFDIKSTKKAQTPTKAKGPN